MNQVLSARTGFMVLLLMSVLLGVPAYADQSPSYHLTITDQGFKPEKIEIPTGKRVQLKVQNHRKLPSEFESYDLNRETLVPAGNTISVWIGPLDPGHYQFFDDFNPGKTGHVIVQKNTNAK